MKVYRIKIDIDGLNDIEEATEWYNSKLTGLGASFSKQVKNQINSLKSNPLTYTIRYANVRCMLVKKFPFLVHFSVDEKQKVVEIFAVMHTSRNPKIWERNVQP